MADFITMQDTDFLHLKTEYSNSLDIGSFMQMLKDPSFCYKFYWLEALVRLITEGTEETTFEAVIDEMICAAWYSVCEFHIHLSGMRMGQVQDGLELAVLRLKKLSGLSAGASRVEIHNALKVWGQDAELCRYKAQLTNMVPYRALAGFFAAYGLRADWGSVTRMTEFIRQVDAQYVVLPYTLGNSNKLKKEVYFSTDWSRMICDNAASILGWIQFEKTRWLQNNNPEVPGLVYKLTPMDEKLRKLSHVTKLWEGILEQTSVRDVFTGEELQKGTFDVDHFIPWSFVMNDELWNLMPMDSSLNRSKSNRLPQWDPFFERFARNQLVLYELLYRNDGIYNLYLKCQRDNMHSIWAAGELYRPGNTEEEFTNILQKNMQPVYDSARRQGYELWQYAGMEERN